MKHMTMPGSVHVDFLGWKEWKVGPFGEKQPNPHELAWIYRQLIARKRPFILMDIAGGNHNIVDVVNAKVLPIHLGDRRLMVVYTYTLTDGNVVPKAASYGELLFMDDGPRLPTKYHRDFYTLKVIVHEWFRGREGG